MDLSHVLHAEPTPASAVNAHVSRWGEVKAVPSQWALHSQHLQVTMGKSIFIREEGEWFSEQRSRPRSGRPPRIVNCTQPPCTQQATRHAPHSLAGTEAATMFTRPLCTERTECSTAMACIGADASALPAKPPPSSRVSVQG